MDLGKQQSAQKGGHQAAIKNTSIFHFPKKKKKPSFKDLAFKMCIYGSRTVCLTMCLPCMLCTVQNKGGKEKQRKA